MLPVKSGRPSEERSPEEEAVYDALDRLRIPYVRIDHEPIDTMEGSSKVGEALGIALCKNLFLCNSQRTKFYLLMMPGAKRFVTREFCRQLGIPRVSFAPEEAMREYLHIAPGSVSVMGLLHDREGRVQLVMDRDVLEQEYLGCHPCRNTTSMKLSMRDLLDGFLPFTRHGYRTVDLPWE